MLINILSIIRMLVISILLLNTEILFASDWHYTVQQGDSLWKLTETYLPDISYVNKLSQYNAIKKPVELVPGTELLIPLAWLTSHTSEAKIVAVHGNVVVFKHQQQRKQHAVSGITLRISDELITEPSSSAIVSFQDGSRVLLQENTHLIFKHLEYYPQAKLLDSGLFLQEGRIETLVPPKRKHPSRFEIETASAIAAVRGTVLRSATNPDHNIQIEVLSGKVSVIGATAARSIPAGYAIIVAKGQDPGQPVQLLATPELVDPPTLIDRYSMRFVWQPVIGAKHYRTQLFDSASPARLVFDERIDISKMSAPQLPDGDYTLTIRAIDIEGLEGLDTSHQFTLNAQPEPPSPAFPEHAQQLESASLILRWAQRLQANAYHLQISSDQQFNHLIVDLELSETEFRPNQPLVEANYFWRLATRVGNDTGPYSDTQSFRIIPATPAPLPVSGDEQHMVLRWQAGDAELNYQIQVASNPQFTAIVQDQQFTEPRLEIDRPTTETLFVRMRALDSSGYSGNWGTTQLIEPAKQSPWYLFLLPLLFLLLLI